MCRAFVSARSELKYATISSPFTFFLSPERWHRSRRVLLHSSQLNPRGQGEALCNSYVLPWLHARAALPLAGSCQSPTTSRAGGGGRFLGLPPARALGFSGFRPPACLNCSPPSAVPPPHTWHEEAVHGGCSELSAARPRETPRPGSRGRRTSPQRARGPHFGSAPCTQSVLHSLLFNPLRY